MKLLLPISSTFRNFKQHMCENKRWNRILIANEILRIPLTIFLLLRQFLNYFRWLRRVNEDTNFSRNSIISMASKYPFALDRARRRCLQQRQLLFLKTVVQKGIQFTWKRSGSPCYLSDVVTRGVASQDYQRVVFIFIGEGEIRIGRESARTTGDHHVLRSAAAVHMADEKVTVALHLWVTLHYHAIITRPLSFFLPFLHYSSPSWNSSNLSKSFHFFF